MQKHTQNVQKFKLELTIFVIDSNRRLNLLGEIMRVSRNKLQMIFHSINTGLHRLGAYRVNN